MPGKLETWQTVQKDGFARDSNKKLDTPKSSREGFIFIYNSGRTPEYQTNFPGETPLIG